MPTSVTSIFQLFSNGKCCVRAPLINLGFNIGDDDAVTYVLLPPFLLHTHLKLHVQVSAKSIS